MSAARRLNRRRKTASARLARAIASTLDSVRGNPALALPLGIVVCAVATLMACSRPVTPPIDDTNHSISAASGVRDKITEALIR
jgi:hypothetical protein